jgi:lipase ATG15
VGSACWAGGYALESRCHQGRVLRYDTVARGWTVDTRTHGIAVIVEKVLDQDWEPPLEGGKGREVPEWTDEDADGECQVSRGPRCRACGG